MRTFSMLIVGSCILMALFQIYTTVDPKIDINRETGEIILWYNSPFSLDARIPWILPFSVNSKPKS